MNESRARGTIAVGLLAASLTLASACISPFHCDPALPDGVASGAVMLVRTPRHIQVALKSAAALLDGEGVRVSSVHIIVCDEAVSALVQDQDLIRAIEGARTRGVRTVACGLSLERFGVDRTTLPRFIDVVPNGIVETFRLQSLGFLSVEL